MSEVKLERVEKRYGSVAVVRDLDLTVGPGEFVTLLGPSGCGKTTCLRMIAGFVMPSRGKIWMAGRDVTALPPYRRNTAMVFQSYALFPHRTVAENIGFGLEVRRLSRSERDDRTAEALRLVRLGHLADRYPSQLSGGQRQRVALARAVVIKPDVLLLDEPLAALDLKLREELQLEIKRVQSALGITSVFVTHDQGEALSMSDRVAVMDEGCIVQIAAPEKLYERPGSRYVANFVGRTNLLEVLVVAKTDAEHYQVETVKGQKVRFTVSGRQHDELQIGERCLLGARPEHFHLGAGRANAITATVRNVTYHGSIWHIEVEGASGETFTALARPGDAIPARGEAVPITWTAESCFLLRDEPAAS
ncbi:MAG: ABC transporter ATP-binding protein [Xanthobacteraceae bacterium]